MGLFHPNSGGQQIVDIIPTILDGNGTTTPTTGNHGDGFAAVTAQGEQKSIQLFVIGLDGFYDILFANIGRFQIHNIHPKGAVSLC